MRTVLVLVILAPLLVLMKCSETRSSGEQNLSGSSSDSSAATGASARDNSTLLKSSTKENSKALPPYTKENGSAPFRDAAKEAGQEAAKEAGNVVFNVLAEAFGKKCEKNEDCYTPNSVCDRKICRCDTDYDHTLLGCVLRLGGSCNRDRPCNRPFAQCNNGRCSCRTGYTVGAHERDCVKKATNIEENCEVPRQCEDIRNSNCLYGGCRCVKGHFFNRRTRHCDRSSCQTQQCKEFGYAMCERGMCVCRSPDGFQEPNTCYRRIGTIGASCNSYAHEKCWLLADGSNQRIECMKGKCECIQPAKPDRSMKRCVGGSPSAAVMTPILLLFIVAISIPSISIFTT